MGWIESLRDWLSKEPEYKSGFKFNPTKRAVTKVYIHCSASDDPESDNVESIRAWHYARGFNDIGYHYYINHYGYVADGRDLERIPAAQRGHNTGSIAICLGGLTNFSETQFDTLRDMAVSIRDAYLNQGVQITFHGHNEVNKNKDCPVFPYREVLKLDKNGKCRL